MVYVYRGYKVYDLYTSIYIRTYTINIIHTFLHVWNVENFLSCLQYSPDMSCINLFMCRFLDSTVQIPDDAITYK